MPADPKNPCMSRRVWGPSRLVVLKCCLVVLVAALLGLTGQAQPPGYVVVADLSTVGADQASSSLVRGHDGAFYGVAASGGSGGCGVVYRLAADDSLSVVHHFQRANGCNPVGDLAVGPDGSLYGVTYVGGTNAYGGSGTIYRIAPDGTHRVLYHMPAGSGGANPYGGLVFAPDGLLYGVTTSGVTYRLSTTGGFQALLSGYGSHAALTIGSDGRLYGTYSSGGGGGAAGHIFRLEPPWNGAPTLLHSLYCSQTSGCPAGSMPQGELAEGPDGAFYGTTSQHGPTGMSMGTVFRFTPADRRFETLHAFDSSGGAAHSPWAGLTLGSDGFLYGMTTAGGTNGNSNGVLYRLSLTGEYEELHAFDGTRGGGSQEARLLEVEPGVFLGATASTGIFRFRTGATHAPVAEPGAFDTNEDQPLAGVLVGTDADGQPLTYSVVAQGTKGFVTVTDPTTGAFTYAPSANVSGPDTFTFRVSDGSFWSNTATVSVNIVPVNDAPVAHPAQHSVVEDGTLSDTLQGSDIDSAALAYAIVSQPTHGRLTLTSATSGAFTYTPAANYTGSDAFTFQVSDGALQGIAVVSLDVTPSADVPTATTGVVTTTEGAPVSGTLRGSDPDGGPVTFSIATPPAQGSVVLDDAATGAFTYTPNASASGYDPFTFVVQDSDGSSASATQMVFVVAGTPNWPGQTVRVSVGGNGQEANDDSVHASFSGDGRYVAFTTHATNLSTTNQPGEDILILDRVTGIVEAIPTTMNDGLRRPVLSADGRYVVYKDGPDVWVRDRTNGVLESARAPGTPSPDGSVNTMSISADGRYVVFDSMSTNRVAGDTNGAMDVFRFDRITRETERISVSTLGAQADGFSFRPQQSADGRWIVFESSASNLVDGDTNGTSDVFLYDASLRTVRRVSVSSAGDQGDNLSTNAAISADGSLIAFTSSATNLAPGDTSSRSDIYLHHVATGTTELVRPAVGGTQTDRSALAPRLSADGRYVCFFSPATNVVEGDTNNEGDVFVHDRVIGSTRRVSVTSSGAEVPGYNVGDYHWLSGDGRFVAFGSNTSALVDGDTNGQFDIFVVGGVEVTQTTASFGPAGGSGTANVRITYPGPAWTATSGSAWLSITEPAGGTGSGAVSYTVAPNETGQPRTGRLTVSAQEVVVTQAAATNPVAAPTSISTTEDTPVSGVLTGSDPNGDALTFTISGAGNLGTVVITNPATGAFTYTPRADVFGTDTFSFQVSDGTHVSAPAVVTVTITPVNDAPVALADTISTLEDTPKAGMLRATDVDGPAVSFAIVAQPTRGTVVLTDAATGAFSYTPDANVNGTDSFTFQASDGTSLSSPAVVTIDITPVDDAPVARDGVVVTSEGTAVEGALQAVDVDGDAIAYAVATPPGLGIVSVTDAATGRFTYTPNAGATGYDSFTFRVAAGDTEVVATQMVLIVAGQPRWPGQTVRASVGAAGVQGLQGSGEPRTSADGRYVVFSSDAPNLVLGDTNNATDIFVRDRLTGTTSRVSVVTGGGQADGGSTVPSISADGRYVAFESQALNLAPGGVFSLTRVFVHDRHSGVTSLVSVGMAGAPNLDSRRAVLSVDGRFVAFDSGASNLVATDTNAARDVFVFDRIQGTTTRVSVSSTGSQGNANSFAPSLSADGRWVAFHSTATTLVGGDGNARSDVFVHDRQTGQTTRVSVSTSGVEGNNGSSDASISADGRVVAFHSSASNLVAGDLANASDVFVHDRATGETSRVSLGLAGAEANGASFGAAVSADARYVAFRSVATNLTEGAATSGFAVFVHDRSTASTRRVDVSSAGVAATGNADAPSLSADGQFVAFATAASLVPGDTNAASDAFVVGGATVEPRALEVPAAGGTNTAMASVAYAGPWVATSNVAWITVVPPGGAEASGAVSFNVAPNPGPARTGVLHVALQAVTVTQAANTLPTITVASPVDGASYALHEVVLAEYGCADAEGSPSCSGAVPAGAPIDTTTPGTKTFDVVAVDEFGGSATRTVSYTVRRGVPVITWGSPSPITYGTALGAAQLAATADVAGTFVYTPATGVVLPAGAHVLTAAFTAADATTYDNATATTSLDVLKAVPALILGGGPFVYDGQPHAASVSAIGGAGETLAPVLLTYDGATTVPVDAGTYAVVATYGGDANHLPRVVSGAITINKVASATTLSSSVQAPVFGQSTTLTATVSIDGTVTPTGEVEFFADGVSLGVASLSGVSASLAVSSLDVGSRQLTAAYRGSPNVEGSDSSPVLIDVARASTAAALSTMPNPSGLNVSTAVTATVTSVAPGAGLPSGSVEFYDGATMLGTAALVAGANGATATIATSFGTSGAHTLTARYAGDPRFDASASDGTVHMVSDSAATTTTALTLSSVSVAVGSPVTLNATVSVEAGRGVPTGAVEFFDGSRSLGMSALVQTGGRLTAALTTSSLDLGEHTLTARYPGDAVFAGSSSAPSPLSVYEATAPRDTTTGLTSSPNPSTLGQVVTLRADVRARGQAQPTGTVDFYAGTVLIGSAPLVLERREMIATLALSALPQGVHQLKAIYRGNGELAPSGSAVLTQCVSCGTRPR